MLSRDSELSMFKARLPVGGTALLLNGDIAGVPIGCDPLPDGFRGFEQGSVIGYMPTDPYQCLRCVLWYMLGRFT